MVLVVCVELCTLHLHVRNDTDTIMGNALFADGAAAAVVMSATKAAALGLQPLARIAAYGTRADGFNAELLNGISRQLDKGA